MKKVKLSELTPDDINANKGTQRGAGMLEKSLRDYGAGRSVLVDKAGRIIAGNKTIEAAGAIGLDDAIVVETDGSKVVIVKRTDLDLDSPQGRGLAIADNRVAEVGLEWDMEALEKIGEELDLGEFWFDDELPEIDFGSIDEDDEPTGDADAVPEVEAVPTSKRGDLWILGEHRVLCGDSTSAEDVARLMNGERAYLCFTSPPYFDQREYCNLSDLSVEHISDFILRLDDCDFLCINLGLSFRDNALVCYWDEYIKKAVSAGFWLCAWNVWHQIGGYSIGQLTRTFPTEHEFIFVFERSKLKLKPTVPNSTAGRVEVATDRDAAGKIKKATIVKRRDFRELGSVLSLPTVSKNDIHSAMYPVELPASYLNAINLNVVYDPFLGSGSTLIAAEETGRKCYGMEISPQYVDVIIKRWQDYTGKEATHEDGRTFAQVAEERADSEKESTKE